MLSPFSCGFFHPEDVHDEPISSSPCSTPRRSSRRSGKDSKNPYSSRGLDKFSALLADLEEKRQKIYAETPPQDISFVRFVFKDSNDDVPVPIVIKVKDKKEDQNNNKISKPDQYQVLVKAKHATPLDKFTVEPSTPTKEVSQEQPKTDDKKRRVFWSWSFSDMNLGLWKRPSFYLPVVMVFILVLLAVFGRSVAILCTSIGWYALPTLKESSSRSSTRKASKKKDHVRRFSDNNNKTAADHHGLSSPKSSSPTAGTPRSQQHGHRKSW
ncbi:hypothetical protein GBA52_015562 [Prunus armeniaca]|nr:hypothetical protein GBA52_015562 [Prunus armeniaca]